MTELESLREEVAALRREIADLRAERVVHHYHHQAAPAPFIGPPTIAPNPYYPAGPAPATCGGSASGIALGMGTWAQNSLC